MLPRLSSYRASFKSMNDAEVALNDSDIAATGNGAHVNNGYSHLEDGALNTRRASNNYQMASTSFSMDLSNGYELQDRRTSATSGAGVESVSNENIYPDLDYITGF
ncbi:hypothetical protein ElyMa_005620100 [Elysia marginata]|uniref:Uncharacterized protein n=1 Tax=Elysia marginata TaxID=1093978 RepID=A0AAV4F7U2_9GAST|nr:hypothetical protein ElyMa_005620100 [Elysia marginata]